LMVKKTFRSALYLSVLAILAAFFPVACGGGGGGGGSGSGGSTKVILTGTVDSHVITQNGASSNPVPNAVVHLVDPSGNSITTTTNASGQYTAQVTKLTDYGVTVDMPSSKPGTKSASDPVTMRGVVFVGGSDSSLNVNPGSSAAVIILMRLFNVTIGVPGTPFGPGLPTGNLAGVINNIYNTPGFTALANAVSLDIANHVNPFADPNLDALIQAVINAYTAPTTLGPVAPPVTNPLSTPLSIFIISCNNTGGFFGQVDAGWNPLPGVSGFQVYFGTSPDQTDPAGTIVTITNGSAVDSGTIPLAGFLMDHTTYNFSVRAYIIPIDKPQAESRPVYLPMFGPWSENIKFHTSSGEVISDAGFYRCSASQNFTF